MSTPFTIIPREQTRSTLITDYDTSNIFIGDNKTTEPDNTLENLTGAEVTLPIGTLVGRISGSQNLKVLESGSTDGSQFPVGVLLDSYTIAATSTVSNVAIVIGGEVDQTRLIFQGTDDFDTVVADRSYRDRIASDNLGFVLRNQVDLSKFDN